MTCSTIGTHDILQTLGSGASATVRLARNQTDGELVAMKIFSFDNKNSQQQSRMLNEAKMQSQLDHANIIKLHSIVKRATWREAGGLQSKVCALVTDLAPNGSLFDIIQHTGAFRPDLVRHYAQQLVQAIHYVHCQGIVHRDLKPENLLLGENFNLKLADFGLADSINGTSASGLERTTFVGTQGYMAPEIHLRVPFQGQVVDLFAIGVILFVMQAGTFPFKEATQKDPYYKHICRRDYRKFWSLHERHHAEGTFSKSFKDLISSMLAFQPFQRLSLSDIVFHEWFKEGSIATQVEIETEMKKRFNKVKLGSASSQASESYNSTPRFNNTQNNVY